MSSCKRAISSGCQKASSNRNDSYQFPLLPVSSLIPQSHQSPSTHTESDSVQAAPSAVTQIPKIDFREVFNAALRWAWLPVTCLIIGAIAMFCYASTLPTLYTSYGSLYIKTKAPVVFSGNAIADEGSNDLEQMKTTEQGLLSASVLLRVAEKLDLASDPLFRAGGLEPQEILDTLSSRISVELRKGTRLMDISAKDTDPQRAAQIVESIVEEYEIWQDGGRSELITKTTAQLAEQEKRMRQKMGDSEQRLQDFRQENLVLGLNGAQEQLETGKLEMLNQELATASNDRLRLEMQFQALAASPDGVSAPNLAARGERGQLVMTLEEDIAAKKAEFAKIKERYKFKHPLYIEADNELKGLQKSLAEVIDDAEEGLANDLQVARSREKNLESQVAKAKTVAINAEGVREQFSQLTRAVEIDRNLYSRVAMQLQETQIGGAFDASFLNWDAHPLVPVRPSSPNKFGLILVGCFLGGLLGTGLALLLALIDPRVREPSAVERKLRIPMLARLPAYGRDVISDLSIAGDGTAMLNRPAHLARYTPAPREGAEQMQSLLFASPFEGDGKTLCVMKCARTMVKQGYRTLVIDADFSSPGLSREYSGQREGRHGLAAYLTGEAEPAEVLFETGLPGLWFLPTGAVAGDSGDLLSGPHLRRLLTALTPMVDRVIFDMSAALESDDVQAVARHIGATYLVAQKGKGKYSHLKETGEILVSAGANMTGFIWNDGGRRQLRSTNGPVIEPMSYPAEVREVSPRGENEPMPAPSGAAHKMG